MGAFAVSENVGHERLKPLIIMGAADVAVCLIVPGPLPIPIDTCKIFSFNRLEMISHDTTYPVSFSAV